MSGGQKTIGVLCKEAAQLMKAKYWQLVSASLPLVIAACVMSVVLFAVYMVMYVFMIPTTMMSSFFPAFLLPLGASGMDDSSLYAAAGVSIAMVLVMTLIMLLFCMVLMIVALAVSIVEMTVEVSVSEAMLLLLKGDKPAFNAVFGSFKKNWKRYLGISAWSTLWTFLWSLLLFVPGVIKSCSYMMAPYLVVQYPEMTVKQALKKSMEMTEGYKGRLFVISLIMAASVYVVAFVLCCVPMSTLLAGLFWIYPFYFSMLTIAYLDIKQAAMERGLLPAGAERGKGNAEGVNV